LRKIKRHPASVAMDVGDAPSGIGEKQNQLLGDEDGTGLDKLKLKEEENSMECEATPSGQEHSKDGGSKNFSGGPSSWYDIS